MKKKLFSRAARQQVGFPKDWPTWSRIAVRQRVIDLLSLARKSGQAIAGYEKCRELAMADAMAVLIQAADGSTRGKTKLRPPDGPSDLYRLVDGPGIGFGIRS